MPIYIGAFSMGHLKKDSIFTHTQKEQEYI